MSSSGQSMSSSGSSPTQPTSSGSSLSSQSSSTSRTSTTNTSSTPHPASSTSVQSVETSTSTTSTTSSTPTTTPQSSPAQTSSAAAQTTAPSESTLAASASSSSPSTATAEATSSSSFTSQVATTLVSTDPGGSVVYVTSTVPEVITTSVSSSTGGSSSSNTGLIVGAVVGGVAGITILAILLFCIRRRARKDEFDGNFDPDRVVGHNDAGGGTLPHVEVADEVTPFPQSYTDQGNGSMRQYGKSPYVPVPSSFAASGHPSTEFYPTGAGVDAQPRSFMQPGAGPPHPGAYVPPINMYGTGPVDWHSPRPGVSPPPSTVSGNTSSGRGTKEREALGRAGQGVGLGLATQPEAAEGSGDVVVHQDAGRAPIEEHAPPPREIPPAYESIRQDH